ncbi:MAG: HD domain-containing protein [Pseudomonadales bacterium]|nr:HD domain-containing protein [Pseudomonadales bacterium]
MNDINQLINDIDASFLDDFAETINAELDAIETALMSLQTTANNHRPLELTIKSINNIQVACRLIFMDPLLNFVNGIEGLLRSIHTQKIHPTESLTELLLIAFDEIRAAKDDLILRQTMDTTLLGDFQQRIVMLAALSPKALDAAAKTLIPEFSSRVHQDLVFVTHEVNPHYDKENQVANPEPTATLIQPLRAAETSTKEDLSFFQDIAESIESTSELIANRSYKSIAICGLINNYLKDPVNQDQLSMAVYAHDMAMAFLPDSLIYKRTKYTSEERMTLEQHPIQAYGILSRLPRWQTAANIILQHHERYDGSGYPNALQGDQISTGAKILAIADAYLALTNKRADRQFKKSTNRAISEINKYNGTQFDPLILDSFNNALEALRKKNTK